MGGEGCYVEVLKSLARTTVLMMNYQRAFRAVASRWRQHRAITIRDYVHYRDDEARQRPLSQELPDEETAEQQQTVLVRAVHLSGVGGNP